MRPWYTATATENPLAAGTGLQVAENSKAAQVAKGNQAAKEAAKWLKTNKKKHANIEAEAIMQDRSVCWCIDYHCEFGDRAAADVLLVAAPTMCMCRKMEEERAERKRQEEEAAAAEKRSAEEQAGTSCPLSLTHQWLAPDLDSKTARPCSFLSSILSRMRA